MADLLIHNATLLEGDTRRSASLLVREGMIVNVGKIEADPSYPRIDAGGRLLTPGLIDLHIHGVHRFLFEDSPESLVQGVAALARYGVTTVLPTLYRCLGRDSFPLLRKLVAALDDCDTVQTPGFHCEGPFLKLGGAGAMTLEGDVALLDELLELTAGRMASMSISPDTPGIVPVIEKLVANNVKVFITHTRASVIETVAAIEAGASHATHFYDVFPVPPETEPGARPVGCVEAVLADPRVSVDFICDGIHVDPMAIKMALAAKGLEKVLLITDANIGAGLAARSYDTPWGFKVQTGSGSARIDLPGDARHGALAGSTLTMPRGIANLLRWLDLPAEQVWATGSRNPALRMGWKNKGVLKPDADADFVLWDQADDGSLTAHKTWVAGRLVHDLENTSTASHRAPALK